MFHVTSDGASLTGREAAWSRGVPSPAALSSGGATGHMWLLHTRHAASPNGDVPPVKTLAGFQRLRVRKAARLPEQSGTEGASRGEAPPAGRSRQASPRSSSLPWSWRKGVLEETHEPRPDFYTIQLHFCRDLKLALLRYTHGLSQR